MATVPATYIGSDSAQFTAGTTGFLSDATNRRAWFSLCADGSDGCYVHTSDVADQSQMDRARDACDSDALTDLVDAARDIVAIDAAADAADL